MWRQSLGSPRYPALGEVVNGDLNSYFIAGQYANIVHSQLPGYVSHDYVPIRELDLEGCVGQCLKHNAFKLNYVIFCQNNPSLLFSSRVTDFIHQSLSISVSILGPSGRIATVFS